MAPLEGQLRQFQKEPSPTRVGRKSRRRGVVGTMAGTIAILVGANFLSDAPSSTKVSAETRKPNFSDLTTLVIDRPSTTTIFPALPEATMTSTIQEIPITEAPQDITTISPQVVDISPDTTPPPTAKPPEILIPWQWRALPGNPSWPCDPIDVLIDPSGATEQDLVNVRDGFKEIEGITNRSFKITEAPINPSGKPPDKKIVIAWKVIYGVNLKDNLQTAATSYESTGGKNPELSSAVIVFRSERTLLVTVLHEFGHMLGLDHSIYPTDVMFGGNFKDAGVPDSQDYSPGDIAGLKAVAGCPAK